jgi:hypothetical protein
MRLVEAGNFSSFSSGRTGRGWNSPPQFGQRSPSLVFEQSVQKVHSKLQISASLESGGRSLLQHSQLGRMSNIVAQLLSSMDSLNRLISRGDP